MTVFACIKKNGKRDFQCHGVYCKQSCDSFNRNSTLKNNQNRYAIEYKMDAQILCAIERRKTSHKFIRVYQVLCNSIQYNCLLLALKDFESVSVKRLLLYLQSYDFAECVNVVNKKFNFKFDNVFIR